MCLGNIDAISLIEERCKEFLDIDAAIECGFILKRISDMTRTYSQMYDVDKYSNKAQSFGQFG